MTTHLSGDRHALYVGWVLGIGLRHNLPLTPVLDESGNYTAELEVSPARGVTIRLVVPPPPDDWSLT